MSLYQAYTDTELIAFMKGGDESAFSEIFDRYWPKMLMVAYNKIKDMDEAEEIVQDIFVSLWGRREELELVSSLNNYLAVSVKYRVIKVLARRSVRQKYVDQTLHSFRVSDNTTEDWLNFEELHTRLERLVAALPETSRLVYQLSREAGYSHRQIAEELNITEKAVENRLRRTLQSLRMALNHFLFSFLL